VAPTKRYIVTTAVNNTLVHSGFWAAIQQYAKWNNAEILVVKNRYKNPTSKNENKKTKAEEWYDTNVLPYLTDKDIVLGKNLTLFGSMPVQPTASNPTNGMEVYASETSGIIGHVKRQMTVIPTDHRTPRVMWSTGACTVAKYSRTRAGQRAKKHHILGAVVVEIVGSKFYARNVTANARKDGGFSDLELYYGPHNVYENERALSVTLGDIHVGQEDEAALEAAEKLVTLMNPHSLVLHDVLDFDARSHHRQTPEARWDRRFDTVSGELDANAQFFERVVSWDFDGEIAVVESNHHEHLMRWLREFKEENDVVNVPFYLRFKADLYEARNETGKWPNAYELAMRQRGIEPGIRFLTRESKYKLARVEHAFHGDKGVNGARGSIKAYAKLGVKCTIGHSHTPGILDGVFQTGVTGKLDMEYNYRPNTWLHAHVVLHADGKRQMIVTIEEDFRAAA
jgi:hypothetical protein